MLQLMWQSGATTHFHLGDHWNRKWRLLLVSARALPPGSGGFWLVDSRRPRPPRAPRSLRRAHAALSPAQRPVRTAFCGDAAGTCRRDLLWHQLGADGLRPLPLWLPPPAGVHGLSLLGGVSDRPVAASDNGQRLLPSSPAGYPGETATGYSRVPHAHDSPGGFRLSRGADPQPVAGSALAIPVDESFSELRALHPAPGVARPAVASGPLEIPRSRRHFPAPDVSHAATLVLRHADSVADSEVAPRNRVDRVCQLGSGHLALVSHPAQRHRSWTGGCPDHVLADAGSGAAAHESG